jgi:hypothetical protein
MDGLLILEGSLGALSCKLVARSLLLHDLDFLEKRSDASVEMALQGDDVVSELFIARIMHVDASRDRTGRQHRCHAEDTTTVIPPARFRKLQDASQPQIKAIGLLTLDWRN